MLAEAGVLGADHLPLDRPPGRVVARSCCRGAYLRGAFLGGGSLTGPRSPHLEVRTPTPAGASFLRSVASAEEVRLKVSERDAYARAYAKGWEEIEGYLLAAGVVDAVLALEERSVIAEMRSEANRLANADHANLVRTAHAAQRQLDAARGLRASGALESLSSPLQDAARLRLRHPAMSLRELAERASPPTTKASMQRRLAKVVELGGAVGRAVGRSGASRQAEAGNAPAAGGIVPLHRGRFPGNRRFQLQGFSLRAHGSALADSRPAGKEWAGGGAPRTTSSPTVRAPRPDGERGLDPPPGSASPPRRV